MNLRTLAGQALWGLRVQPLRSAATLSCLAMGVMAIILVGSILVGFSAEINRLTFGAYSRAVIIRQNFFVFDQHAPPSVSDGRFLAEKIAAVRATVFWRTEAAQSTLDGETVNYRLVGVSGPYETELDTPIALGRKLTVYELASNARSCILGAYLAKDLHIAAPGQSVSVNGLRCEIVGILEEPRSRPAFRFGSAVITPLGAAEQFFFRSDDLRRGDLDSITLLLKDGVIRQDVEVEVDRLLRARRGVSFKRASPFAYEDALAPLKQVIEQQGLLSGLLLTLALITIGSTVTAFAAISSSTLDSRSREIALRMASGATRRDIVEQVVGESLIQSIAASCLGLGLGASAGFVTARIWGWPFALNLPTGLAGMGFGILTGLLVGVVIARRIAGASPAQTARGLT